MRKIVGICQPHFLPWQGFFEIIKNCDEFVILDDVKKSNHNKNWQISSNFRSHIKAPKIKNLKLKLSEKNNNLLINQCKLSNDQSFLEEIRKVYYKTPYFEKYFEILSYNFGIKKNLLDLNLYFLNFFLEIINCKTTLIKSSDISNDKNLKKLDYILDILKSRNCKTYLSFLGSKAYNEPKVFKKNEIELIYPKYEIRKYSQFFKREKIDYVPGLSVLDLLFNQGDESKLFI